MPFLLFPSRVGGTDNFDSLLNIILIIPLTYNLKSYMAAPFIAVILSILLFLEFALYIFPDKTVLAEFFRLDYIQSAQWKNYLMIANISSVYMIPNTITLFCCVIQHQINKERQTEKPASEEMQTIEDVPRNSLALTGERSHDTRSTLMEVIKTWCTIELHNIMLIVIFLASVMNINLLNLVYLIFSLYYFFFPASIKKIDSKPVRFLKWYAFVHLALIVVYQIPVFPEPSQCELDSTCIAWHKLIGLNKMVYKSYEGSPMCCLLTDAATSTSCPHPYSFEGVMSIVIINIIVNINVRGCLMPDV